MKHVFYLFCLYLGTGILGLTPLLAHERIQESFFRLISAIALVALALAWLARPTGALDPSLMTPVFGALTVVALVYVTLIWAGRPTWAGRLSWIMLPLAAGALTLAALAHVVPGGDAAPLAQAGRGWWPALAMVLAFMTSAGMLGTVLVAMSLGHWYLVSPGLPVYHLHRLTTALAVCVGVSLLVFLATAGGIVGAAERLGADPTLWLVSNMPFIGIRLIMGILIPAALAYRIDRFVRVRSTQKATGLLYVALIFVLFGELVSAYLLVVTAMPI